LETSNIFLKNFQFAAHESLLKSHGVYIYSLVLKTELSIIYLSGEFLQNNISDLLKYLITKGLRLGIILFIISESFFFISFLNLNLPLQKSQNYCLVTRIKHSNNQCICRATSLSLKEGPYSSMQHADSGETHQVSVMTTEKEIL
jgi:hypothetical protein